MSTYPRRAIALSLLYVAISQSMLRANIYQWEYVDPDDPSLGRQVSSQLTPGGAGVFAAPGAILSNRDLTQGYFIGADLTGAELTRSTLIDADFSDAVIEGASFQETTGFTAAQFYSTASYQTGKLAGISLSHRSLPSWNFSGKNLVNARFQGASPTRASFRNADLSGALFLGASLTGTSFVNADLRGADFSAATYVSTSFTNADVRGTVFSQATTNGFTANHLYSTDSYGTGDLRGISLESNDLTGWNFAGQNLSGANLRANLVNTDFSEAIVTNVTFREANMNGANFTAADLRGSFAGWTFPHISPDADTTNAILPNGQVFRFNIAQSRNMSIRNYQPPSAPPPLPLFHPLKSTCSTSSQPTTLAI